MNDPNIYYEIPNPKTFVIRRRFVAIGLVVFGVGLGFGLGFGLSKSNTTSSNPNSNENTSLNQAIKLLSTSCLLIDGNNNFANSIRIFFQDKLSMFSFSNVSFQNASIQTDLSKLKLGRVSGQFMTVSSLCASVGKDATRVEIEQIDVIKRLFFKYSSQNITLVYSSAGFSDAIRNGMLAGLIGLGDGHAIDSSLALLRIFYSLGARYMTLTQNCNLPWVSSSMSDSINSVLNSAGLTDFGRKVIQEMNRLGMIIDLSQTSYKTQIDVLNESVAPVIFSHSAVFTLCNDQRNVRDNVILKLAQKMGIIMLSFNSGLISCSNNSTIVNLINHLNYVKQLVGIDHIGIGASFDDSSQSVPVQGLEDASKYPYLFSQLIDFGWSESDLAKLAGGNILRVFASVENYAKSLNQSNPGEDIISQSDLGPYFAQCRTSF